MNEPLSWVVRFNCLLIIAALCFTCKSTPELHLLHDINPLNTDSTINAIIEIPAGSVDKWEVNKNTGILEADSIDNKPRKIDYLPYPCNYGMVPQTLLAKESGGDGDPLDIIIIGPSVDRGTIVKCHIIGILHLLDSGETDDKLIAVMVNHSLGRIKTLEALNDQYPGITNILETWFNHYKGAGVMQTKGYANAAEAQKVLMQSLESYKEIQYN